MPVLCATSPEISIRFLLLNARPVTRYARQEKVPTHTAMPGIEIHLLAGDVCHFYRWDVVPATFIRKHVGLESFLYESRHVLCGIYQKNKKSAFTKKTKQ